MARPVGRLEHDGRDGDGFDEFKKEDQTPLEALIRDQDPENHVQSDDEGGEGRPRSVQDPPSFRRGAGHGIFRSAALAFLSIFPDRETGASGSPLRLSDTHTIPEVRSMENPNFLQRINRSGSPSLPWRGRRDGITMNTAVRRCP